MNLIPEQHNFICVKFGDNVYGYHIKEGLDEGVNYWGLDKKACPVIWKRFLIAYLVGYDLKRRACDDDQHPSEDLITCLRDNYYQKIRVTFERNKPDWDDDGGSAIYDLNLKISWTT